MLKYRDFVPLQIEEPGFFKAGEYESFDEAVNAANEWIVKSKIQLINLETVVLPNIWSRWEEGSTDAAIKTSGESPSQWHQFLRCWYREN
jgi:hypothetical protein